MPLSVFRRLGVRPDAIMFSEVWGDEVYQRGVIRRHTHEADLSRRPVVALRIEAVGWLESWDLPARSAAASPPPPKDTAPAPQLRETRHAPRRLGEEDGWGEGPANAWRSRAVPRRSPF